METRKREANQAHIKQKNKNIWKEDNLGRVTEEHLTLEGGFYLSKILREVRD